MELGREKREKKWGENAIVVFIEKRENQTVTNLANLRNLLILFKF